MKLAEVESNAVNFDSMKYLDDEWLVADQLQGSKL